MFLKESQKVYKNDSKSIIPAPLHHDLVIHDIEVRLNNGTTVANLAGP